MCSGRQRCQGSLIDSRYFYENLREILRRENSYIHRGKIKLTHNMSNMDSSQYVPYLYMVVFWNCNFKMKSTINRYIKMIKIISLVRWFSLKMVISWLLSFFVLYFCLLHIFLLSNCWILGHLSVNLTTGFSQSKLNIYNRDY